MNQASQVSRSHPGGALRARRTAGMLLSVGLWAADAFPQAAGDADARFAERCKAPGVVKCLGFDEPALAGTIQGVAKLDRNMKVSGQGSLHVAVAPNAGMAPGNVVVPLGKVFGEGSSLFLQWRQRFSPAMVDANLGGNGMKQIVIYDDQPCCEVEVAMLNEKYRGFPQFYTNVMQNWMFKTLPGGDVGYQFDEAGAYCTEKNKSGCEKYQAGEWMTFYYEQRIGKWGQDNSTIKAYWAREGKPLKQYVHITNWRFSQDRPGTANAFKTVWIGPFSVDRTAGNNFPAAETWYDEFIISTEPIADPNKDQATFLRNPASGPGLGMDVRSSRFQSLFSIALTPPDREAGVFIYSMQGREMKIFRKAGSGGFEWDASRVENGIYLIKAHSGNQVLTRKVSVFN